MGVLFVDVEPQLGREGPGFEHELEPAADLLRRLGVGDHVCDGLARAKQIKLAGGDMAQIAARGEEQGGE